MSEPSPQTPAERLVDLAIFVPAGLALMVADEVRKLALRGRREFGGQVDTARVVGRFVVDIGRKRLEKLFDAQPTTKPVDAQDGDDATRGEADEAPGPTHGAASAPRGEASEPSGMTVISPHGADVGEQDAVAASELAIPGYDSLAASQVVQLLGGLAIDELAVVRRYEASHRARRTVLGRVDQLLGAPRATS